MVVLNCLLVSKDSGACLRLCILLRSLPDDVQALCPCVREVAHPMLQPLCRRPALKCGRGPWSCVLCHLLVSNLAGQRISFNFF